MGFPVEGGCVEPPVRSFERNGLGPIVVRKNVVVKRRRTGLDRRRKSIARCLNFQTLIKLTRGWRGNAYIVDVPLRVRERREV